MIDRSILAQIHHLLRPIKNRIANTIARAVVQHVDDAKKLQLLQLEILEGEERDNCEHFQPYGFKSVPLEGAEAVVIFPNGDRSHPLVIAVDDRRDRPTAWLEGEAGLYNTASAVVRLKANGDVEINPGAGGKVYARSAGGTSEELVTKSDFLNHTHASAPSGAAVPPTPVSGAFVYTTKFEAE